jgi:hypothetical protein
MECQYSFDLAFLFSLYPVKQSLLANLPRSSHYTLRFVLRCKGLKGMRREYFVQTAAENGWTSIVAWEQNARGASDVTEHLWLSDAAGNGHLELVKWLLDNKKGDPHKQEQWALKSALECNQEHIVNYLLAERHVRPGIFTLRNAATSGSIRLVRNLLLYFNPCVGPLDLKDDPGLIAEALKNGHAKLARWLIRRGCFTIEDAFYYAAKLGDWRTLRMLAESYGRMHERAFDGALKSGDVALVEYTHDLVYNCAYNCANAATPSAANVVVYGTHTACKHKKGQSTPGAQVVYNCTYGHTYRVRAPRPTAIGTTLRKSGHLAVINWLCNNNIPISYNGSFIQAVKVGDILALERISELHRISSQFLYDKAHVYAAMKKHDHITRWLFDNFSYTIDESSYYKLLNKYVSMRQRKHVHVSKQEDLQYLKKWGFPLRADKCRKSILTQLNWENEKALAEVGWKFMDKPKSDLVKVAASCVAVLAGLPNTTNTA